MLASIIAKRERKAIANTGWFAIFALKMEWEIYLLIIDFDLYELYKQSAHKLIFYRYFFINFKNLNNLKQMNWI